MLTESRLGNWPGFFVILICNILSNMKGVSYITDEKNRKKAVVIDIKTIQTDDESVHDLIDVLVAESRKDDELIDWAEAKKRLKKKNKL